MPKNFAARLLLLAAFLSTPSAAVAAKPDRLLFAKSICTAIETASANNSLDRAFFARLLWKESLFDPNAVSPFIPHEHEAL